MTGIRRKKSEGKIVVVVLAAIMGVFVVGAAGVGAVAYSVMNMASERYSQMQVNPEGLLLQAKESVLGPLIAAENDQAIKSGLSCFSMVTGQDGRALLESLSRATQDEVLSARATELAESLPLETEATSPGLVGGLLRCLEAYTT